MKTRLLCFTASMLLCVPAFAGIKIAPGNFTTNTNVEIAGMVSNLVVAVNANNEGALLSLLHPDCRKQVQDEDVVLFLKFVLSHKIPQTYEWKATNIKDGSALFTLNRLIVKPAYCVDIFWKAPTPEKPEQTKVLSIFCSRQGEKLFVVSYMNDYTKKGLQP